MDADTIAHAIREAEHSLRLLTACTKSLQTRVLTLEEVQKINMDTITKQAQIIRDMEAAAALSNVVPFARAK